MTTDIVRVSVETATRAPAGRTNAYVLGREDALLVDPAGRHDSLDELLERRDVGHVAVTHHHRDHVGGVAAYAREYGLTVWARYGRTDSFAAATGLDPDRTLREGTTLPAGTGVTVTETPGHAPEHVAFEYEGTLVSGDLAVGEGSVVVGAPDGDMRSYLASLRRVFVRNPARLYPGHGPVIDDPRAVCLRLYSHRRLRERTVQTAVETGAQTPAELVEAAYEKDVSAVFDLARATVVAHLEKLAVEGAVRWDGQRARPV